MTTTTILTLLAVLFWGATWLSIGWRLTKRLRNQTAYPSTLILNLAWGSALIFHGSVIILQLFSGATVSIDFMTAGSIVMFTTSLLLFITHLNRPLETLGVFIFPSTVITLLSAAFIPANSGHIALGNGLGIHIFISLLGYSLLTLAALQALLLALQNRLLHNHHPGGLIRTLPPLQDMESLLFKLILLGLILLTASLASGFLFINDLFASGVAHKTFFSLIAWCVFATLLFGHWRWGWRGKTAIRWTLGGFVLLMLAYFGSKFVLEFLVA